MVIDEFASSESSNTLERSIVRSPSSSVAETSDRALPTTGASSAADTLTAKASSTVWPFEVAVTVTTAVPD